GLAKYFDEIMGGPKTKIENLKHFLRKHRLKPEQVIYVGDAHSDVIASRAVKIKAILVGKKHLYERLKEDLEADFRFSSLCEIPYDINGLKKK
ncbi:MAG: HAD hydrolase-like protein, partial [Nanoarchaeota archaeon]